MEKMYQKYKDVAEFRLVYIREAHALDSRWSSPQAEEHNIKDATTFGERCSLAAAFIDNEKLTVPTIVDDIDNTVNEAYSAFPDRLFIVGVDGRIALAAERGPWGFEPALNATKNWLAELSGETIEQSDKPRDTESGSVRDSTSRR